VVWHSGHKRLSAAPGIWSVKAAAERIRLLVMNASRDKRQEINAFCAALCIAAAACFCFSFPCIRAVNKSEHIALDSKINPNDAPLGGLVSLPGIGMARAAAIIDYRQQHSSSEIEPAFGKNDDLQKVKGIGPVTVANISQWLKFD